MSEPASSGFPLFPLGLVAVPGESVPLHVFEDRYRRMIEHCLSAAPGSSERGTRPFRLLERQDDLPYPAGVVEFLLDDDGGEQLDEADEISSASARELYRELVEQATDRQLSEDELNAMSAYQMAATVEFTKDAKQELLELRSEPARLRLLALLLRAAIKRLELIDRAQARAQSNGKVRFG